MTDEQALYINGLIENVDILNEEIDKKQMALVRIYRIFGSDMHDCKLELTTKERMEWMQEIARIASIKVVQVKAAIDKPLEVSNVEVLKTKKPPKTVGVGMAGERSGF